ncbi:hypothetical protein FJZ28_01700 [Candidatus Peregrinibacteria bacterium]|nr:hypothetical protein [Candidatus Peregrinibacteria bacterium]
MITITSLGGQSLKCDMHGTQVVVFPNTPDAKAGISLMGAPMEEAPKGVISWPGEYDTGGVSIRGMGHEEGQRVSYVMSDDSVRIAFLSSPLPDLSDVELEHLGDISILCLPADDTKLAQKLIDEIDPRVLIPLPTKDEKTFGEILKFAGALGKELQSDWKLKGGLPMEGREVVILKPSK